MGQSSSFTSFWSSTTTSPTATTTTAANSTDKHEHSPPVTYTPTQHQSQSHTASTTHNIEPTVTTTTTPSNTVQTLTATTSDHAHPQWTLPPELFVHVMQHLDGGDRLSVMAVCRQWRHAFQPKTIWKHISGLFICVHASRDIEQSLHFNVYDPAKGVPHMSWPMDWSQLQRLWPLLPPITHVHILLHPGLPLTRYMELYDYVPNFNDLRMLLTGSNVALIELAIHDEKTCCACYKPSNELLGNSPSDQALRHARARAQQHSHDCYLMNTMLRELIAESHGTLQVLSSQIFPDSSIGDYLFLFYRALANCTQLMLLTIDYPQMGGGGNWFLLDTIRAMQWPARLNLTIHWREYSSGSFEIILESLKQSESGPVVQLNLLGFDEPLRVFSQHQCEALGPIPSITSLKLHVCHRQPPTTPFQMLVRRVQHVLWMYNKKYDTLLWLDNLLRLLVPNLRELTLRGLDTNQIVYVIEHLVELIMALDRGHCFCLMLPWDNPNHYRTHDPPEPSVLVRDQLLAVRGDYICAELPLPRAMADHNGPWDIYLWNLTFVPRNAVNGTCVHVFGAC